LDTQKLKPSIKFQNHTFYNTWSGLGMIAESLDPIQLGHPNKNTSIDSIIKKKGFQKQNIRFYPVRGMDRTENTIIITPHNKELKTKGFLIPHGEANTLSLYLSSKNYIPSVYYVYHPSYHTLKSLENLKKRNYVHQPIIHPVLEQKDLMRNGYDSIGAHLIFDDIPFGWWTGTVLTLEDVRKLGIKYAGPTETQVAISYLACIEWMLFHPSSGICFPEDLPSLSILKRCKPYLGKFVNRKISKIT
jgi:homospermidine synthase